MVWPEVVFTVRDRNGFSYTPLKESVVAPAPASVIKQRLYSPGRRKKNNNEMKLFCLIKKKSIDSS